MNLEFHALLHNQTWDLVPLSLSFNVLGPKWILKTKRKADGTLERRKARLVAKPTTIRILLSLAVTHNWSLQ